VIEGQSELSAGLHETEHYITSLKAMDAYGAAGDLALGHAGGQIILRGIGMTKNLGLIENLQQFVLAPVQAHEQLVEGKVSGAQT
jgi:hypothetical protein